MRIVGAALLALAVLAMPAAAQTDNAATPGVAAKPTTTKFRKPAVRPATLRARAAVGRGLGQSSETSVSGDPVRAAAAAGRKRLPAPGLVPAPSAKGDGAMSPAARIAIQLDLAWTGDYNGLINGESGERTTAAIKSFQRNRKFKETGVLNTQERTLLAAAAKARQSQVGWQMVEDPITGARLGLPSKQVPIKVQGKAGTRWSSAQGQVQVETFRVREPGTTLALVHDQQRKEPSTRKLEVNLIRPDFFILSGMQGQKRFYVRAEIKDGEVRGMTVLFDPATEGAMEPVVVAMSSAFVPFPGASGVVQIVPPPRRKVEYGTGVVVSTAGHILTDHQITDGCNVIVVAGYGDADRQAEASGLALLRVYGVVDLAPAAFAPEPPPRTADVTLVGIADPQSQDGGNAISTVAAKLRDETVEPPPQLGFSGSAVLDGQGRTVGLVALKSPMVAVAGGAPQPQATMLTSQSIRAFLEAQKLAPAAGRAGLDAAKSAVVRVICVRK
jgi:peptidoglycan hydrolase-like protein with peptidoglycan-binding domain